VVVVVAVGAGGMLLDRVSEPAIEGAGPSSAAGPAPSAAGATAPAQRGPGGVKTPGVGSAAPGAGHRPAAPAAGPALGHAVAKHFERGVALLHAGQPLYAGVAFHEVLRLAPRLPEAHVNMGFALLAQQRPAAARDFFLTAIELRPAQTNAYYGLAVASEETGDMPGALGAMRTFVHLAPPQDPFVRKARAALWEWQARAGAPPPGEHAAPSSEPTADGGR
jgi:tetratricopeptide (TPR) repeat protein